MWETKRDRCRAAGTGNQIPQLLCYYSELDCNLLCLRHVALSLDNTSFEILSSGVISHDFRDAS